MKYFIGPWQWVTDRGPAHFAMPVEAIGAIDLGTVDEMGTPGNARKGCLCWTADSELGSDYDLVASGDVREIKRTAKIAAMLRKTVGTVPGGDSLHDMIFDCLVGAADPDGLTAPKPIVPGVNGWMDLQMPGHGRVKSQRFEWGKTPHTVKLKRLLRTEFSQLMKDAEAGKLKDQEHHRRVLDAMCEKYGIEDWKEFIEPSRQKDVPGRLKHETTITETFNTADGTTLGPLLTWSEVSGNWTVASNAAVIPIGGVVFGSARAQSDLSSADHYAKVTVVSSDNSSGLFTQVGPSARFNSSAGTYYAAVLYRFGNSLNLQKIVNNVQTGLSGPTITVSLPELYEIRCNGSTQKTYQAGVERSSITDTSITGNLRSGICGYTTAGSATMDDFEASDLAASGLTYTQLESTTRGVERGIYTGWGR
jgi:hypothetical protein